MPILKGKVRRPNLGRGQTTTTSVSFVTSDFLWATEQATMRSCSFALIVGEAMSMYREAMDAKLTEVEKEEKRARILATRAATAKRKLADAAPEPVTL